MATVFQHWVGEITAVEKSVGRRAVYPIDLWLPAPPSVEVSSFAKDTISNLEMFPGAAYFQTYFGPIEITVGVDLFFRGTIEYFTPTWFDLSRWSTTITYDGQGRLKGILTPFGNITPFAEDETEE